MGTLDGLTILRYAHAYESGGGLERYLADLNEILGQRNNFRTIQVQMTSSEEHVGEAETTAGQSSLLRVSLFVDRASHAQAILDPGHASLLERFLRWAGDRLVFAPGLLQKLGDLYLTRRRIPRRPGEPSGAGETVRALHARYGLDLICLHSAGGADANEILAVAEEEEIPVVYIHHFANDRLSSLAMRAQLRRVRGIAGVSSVAVPSFLKPQFDPVYDGIDADFFRRDRARPVSIPSSLPLVFLPARITPQKGQADLLRAVALLRESGLACQVAFAGRVDQPAFLAELEALAREAGFAEHVHFIGELDTEALRDWFAAASLLVFPTRHHEGLPRILMEAQAMELPVIVYNSGGSSDGLKDGETGHLVTPGDFRALASRMKAILEEPSRRGAMASAARRLVEERFTLPALAERHEQFYKRVLQPQTAPAPVQGDVNSFDELAARR